jgi:hypothetical protein
VRADEHHIARQWFWCEQTPVTWHESNESFTPIGVRCGALDDPSSFQYVEMVREEGRGDPGEINEFTRRAIGTREFFCDCQPSGLAEGGKHPGTSL